MHNLPLVADEAPARRVVTAIEKFLQVETASSLVLLLAAAGAQPRANSPWFASYHHLWDASVSFGIREHTCSQSVPLLNQRRPDDDLLLARDRRTSDAILHESHESA